MSNCINIVYKQRILLKPHQVNAHGLKKLIEEAEQKINNKNCLSEDTKPELRIAWWFLSLNTIFKPRGGVDIIFGDGRSGHTWRDFRGTLRVLSQFITTPVQIRFGITDEYDEFKSIERISINLQDDKIN